MHEVSLMQNTLDLALAYAEREKASKIHRLIMRIGAVSGVVPEALKFAFDIVTQGTIAEGAELEIHSVPVVCYCPNCHLEFKPLDLIYECPQCGKFTSHIRQGREIELSSLEISSVSEGIFVQTS